VGGMRRESEPVAHNQFLFDWVHDKPENFESCRAKDRLLARFSKSNCTGAFLPSMINSTAVVSRSNTRPSASENGKREKAVTPSF